MRSPVALLLGLAVAACADAPAPVAPTPTADARAADAPAAGDAPAADAAGDAAAEATPADAPGAPPPPGVALPADPQREGDPAVGYQVILDGAYVGCGIPDKAYKAASGFGFGLAGEPAPGSTSGLPWYVSRFTTATGVAVVGPNCLTCHAGHLDGQLLVGLGATALDFTDAAGAVGMVDDSTIDLISRVAGLTPAEKEELRRFADRFRTVQPYIGVDTAGVNPADNLAAILFAHRDPETLAWSDTPLLPPPPQIVLPIDVPPWWRMKKKHTMFYVAAGRGDHARIMMTASTLCVDSVAQAEAIDATMPDVRAFVLSVEPPKWPWGGDAALAAQGEAVFEATCAVCHGTYGAEPSYPNLVVPVDEVGTDPVLALGASQFVDRFIDWYHASFYGEVARLEPEEGYVPPPLDGIWATAPFLHNGSVPTLAALLDSRIRPIYWRRSFDSRDYDQAALGWQHEVLASGQDAEPDAAKRKLIYDTTRLGYGSGGHTFGDALTAAERAALLEYLKTL